MNKPLIMFVFGTRPEVIKMYPIIIKFKEEGNFQLVLVSTGQQREMLQQTIKSLNMLIDIDLDIMKDNQSLATLTSRLFAKLDECIKEISPHYLFIHGDTTTSMVAGILGKYNKIKVLHIEAGLRSNDIYSPWPEEMNRKINSLTSDYHFAPTKAAMKNLIIENVNKDLIVVTGNTGIDTLRIILETKELSLKESVILKQISELRKRFILITIHRRENFASLEDIFDSIKRLAFLHQEHFFFLFPVHLNPNVRGRAYKMLDGIKNLILTQPMEYLEFIHVLNLCHFVITDSGGVQEEATYLGKPIILCRDTTERPEGLHTDNIILVGTKSESIENNCNRLIYDSDFYLKHSKPSKVFGDGFASQKIKLSFEKKFT
jgi:UDP-N-acetylglucosamine 2-epimerase (non-hydrolysing)